MESSRSLELRSTLNRLREGDDSARQEILYQSAERLRRLTSKMLKDFPGVRRWEDTDDVFQNACLRLHRALDTVTFPTAEDFYRFASALIRRELIDLSRHYQGPLGAGNHQAKQRQHTDSFTSDRLNPETDTHDPQKIMQWTEFHAKVEELPAVDRQMFDLLWYQDLTQAEAAELLGVSERTVQRRWLNARLRLQEMLGLESEDSVSEAEDG